MTSNGAFLTTRKFIVFTSPGPQCLCLLTCQHRYIPNVTNVKMTLKLRLDKDSIESIMHSWPAYCEIFR